MTFLNREGTSLFPKLDNDLLLDSVGTMGTMFNLLLGLWEQHLHGGSYMEVAIIWSKIKFRKL